MSEQDGRRAGVQQRPTTNNQDEWKAYWKAQGQPWRTEPEIDAERQKYLSERRAIIPDIEQGKYPFKNIKLGRADVEWLLATHENGQGPIDWNGRSQRERTGLDLRGADLSFENLSALPLTAMIGGLTQNDWAKATTKQREMATVNLEGADLLKTHLERAKLRKAHLEQSDLYNVFLQEADLLMARLIGSYLVEAHLENANLRSARLERTNLTKAHLEGTNLRFALFDVLTNLEWVTVGNDKSGFRIADTRWENVNLSMIDWKQVNIIGDEYRASQKKTQQGKEKSTKERLSKYELAVRANRQLAVVLQSQGLNEIASRFAYRAQKLQRVTLRYQKKFGQYLFSLFLDFLAGYGYRPGRSVIWYLATIFGFALAYFAIGHLPFFPDAFVFSLTSFHGRGFFPGLGSENSLHNPLVIMAAFEAVVGLLIEISFIATFTQRFFAR